MFKAFIISLLTFTFLFSAEAVYASLITIDKKGEVVWNVLSFSSNDLELKEVAGDSENDQSILLKREDEKIVLNIGEQKKLDVTNWKDNLIEVEERGDVKKLTVMIKDGKFVINQSDIFAHTDYPININPKENELSLVTPSGSIFLTVLPVEATETSLRSRFVTKITDKNIEIKEKDLGVLSYTIRGEKQIKIFNIMDINIPVTTFVSTTTGDIIFVDQPKWLSMLGFLFS